ncbi:MAG TPA: hypothetical protein VJ085_07760 [Candidatus Acidoferrales bacterium]|nr:hypothetical protein [Candidatus Acidoferrales bacterium]
MPAADAPAIRFARHNFDNLQSLARFGDTKAGSLVVIVIFLFGAGVGTVREAVIHMALHQVSATLMAAFWVSWAVFAIAGIVITLIIIYEVVLVRGASHYSTVEIRRDLMYSEHVMLHPTNESYYQALTAMDPELELRNVSDQVYEIAHIVNAKMRGLREAQNGMKVCLLSWFIGIVFALIILGTVQQRG